MVEKPLMMIGKIITVKNNPEGTMKGDGKYVEPDESHGDQWDGEYIIRDGPMTIGNNPPDIYYLVERAISGSLCLMCITDLSRPWNFRKIGHWTLTNRQVQ